MKMISIILIWISISILNAGFVFADWDDQYGQNSCSIKTRSTKTHRTNLGFSIAWSLIPPSWILTPFVTGFYYSGWRLTSKYTC